MESAMIQRDPRIGSGLNPRFTYYCFHALRDLFLLPINVSDGLSHNNAECVGLLLLPHLQWHFSFLNLEYIFLDA